MNNISYPLAELGILKPLMQKYATKDSDLLPFINHYAGLDNYAEQIQEKSDFAMDRDVLADDLLEQYQAIASVSEDVGANIEKLRLKNTFTVVTGHQPCLFTGPLYFVIKILQTIKLAKTLDDAFPDSTIIPVYWMGAEDHDFEEVNHFHLFKEKLTWESKQEGSVGRFTTEGLDKVYQELSALLGNGEYSAELKELFKKAYLDHANYGEATRYLVNALFGDRGLVIVDGDRPRLKEAFKATMSKELKENLAYRAVNKQIEALQEHGKIQVKPREINLFYLDRLGRNRIIQDVNGVSIDGRKGIRNTEDLVSELQKHPDRFSPNVLLRPVYQETILPNLAYIGGPGETAYWLELKGLFREVNLPMPILEMRNSFLFIQQKQLDKLTKLGMEVKDLFLEEGEWMRKLIIEEEDEMHLFVSEHAQIMEVMEVMKEKAKKIDPTMEQVFTGETVRLNKSLENLEKRVFKAQKRKNEVKIDQVKNIIEKVFPGGGLQERKENFAGFYVVEGKVFFERIYGGIDVMEGRMNVVVV
jgi:bacillithiol biosynthesis cysteine-adding enzyme BshC